MSILRFTYFVNSFSFSSFLWLGCGACLKVTRVEYVVGVAGVGDGGDDEVGVVVECKKMQVQCNAKNNSKPKVVEP